MLRRTPLVYKNLTHQLARTVVSIGGIMLAIVLMFMQLGFLGAVSETAEMVYKKMEFDLMIRSSDYLHMFEASSVDASILTVVAGVPGIEELRPLDTLLGGFSKIEIGGANGQADGQVDSSASVLVRTTRDSRGIAIFGVDLQKPALNIAELRQKVGYLSIASNVIMDRKSSKDFGPKNGKTFTTADINEKAEVNGVRVTIAETIELGTGLAATGAIVVSRKGFERLSGGMNRDSTSLILLRCTKGADAEIVKQQVQKRLKDLGYDHLKVLDRNEVLAAESSRWRWETPVGIIFLGGVALALVVGAVICYMVLASDVIAKLPEYATLKAIGYSDRYLSGLLIKQALALAVASLIPAFIASLILYYFISKMIGVSIEMNAPRVFLVSLLSIFMCMAAGMIAVRKLAKAEPASLF